MGRPLFPCEGITEILPQILLRRVAGQGGQMQHVIGGNINLRGKFQAAAGVDRHGFNVGVAAAVRGAGVALGYRQARTIPCVSGHAGVTDLKPGAPVAGQRIVSNVTTGAICWQLFGDSAAGNVFGLDVAGSPVPAAAAHGINGASIRAYGEIVGVIGGGVERAGQGIAAELASCRVDVPSIIVNRSCVTVIGVEDAVGDAD